MTAEALSAGAARAGRWLTDTAWPLWFARGVDWRRGGFFDTLDQAKAENAADYKRLRVLARQIYVFSEAAAFGWADGLRAVQHGLDFLFGRARRPDGGYAARFDLAGNVTDDRRDLYDLAFTLFALAWAFRATGDGALRGAAVALADYIDGRLRHPAGGFHEGLPPALPRRQNPHMHLFEAAIACLENGWDEPFRGLAEELFALFARRFYQAETGALPEFFDAALAPLPGPVEPGHYHEWVWLLESWSGLAGVAPRAEAAALYDIARRHGAAAADAPVHDEVWPDGRVHSAAARLWPQAERLKACLALFERTGDGGHAREAVAALGVVEDYLAAGGTPGLWCERRRADGSWSDEPAPASSLYHITLALCELRRTVGSAPPSSRSTDRTASPVP